jgi:hypothetical protein
MLNAVVEPDCAAGIEKTVKELCAVANAEGVRKRMRRDAVDE